MFNKLSVYCEKPKTISLKVITVKPNKLKSKSFLKRFYSDNLKSKKLMPAKLVGETRHYPPANKEWTNSVYAYNKNTLKTLPIRDKMAKRLIKNYFILTNCKKLARSRRMRSLIRKSTVKKMFVSKPEIKQTSDKVNVTVYTFDREKQFLLRKIYYSIRKLERKRKKRRVFFFKLYKSYDHWRTKYSLVNSFKKLKSKHLRFAENSHLTRKLKLRYFRLKGLKKSYFYLLNRNYFAKTKANLTFYRKKRLKLFIKPKNKRKKLTRRRFPYLNLKQENEMRFLQFKTKLKREKLLAGNYAFLSGLKRALTVFKVKFLNFNLLSSTGKLEQKIAILKIKNNLKKNNLLPLFFNGKLAVLPLPYKINYLQGVISLVSNILVKLLNKVNAAKKSVLTKNIYTFILKHTRKNYKKFLSKSYSNSFDLENKKGKKLLLAKVKKEALVTNQYVNLKVNNLKFSKLLTGLKLLLSRIYNKKVDLNIVNLKYPHLNTDIFTQAIATKLRKKVGLLRVVRRSLKLAKLPYGFNERVSKYDINKIQSLNIYKSLKLNNLHKKDALDLKENFNSDYLETLLKKIYPRSLVNEANYLDFKNYKQEYKTIKPARKVISVLNTIRYKWLTGVRLEAAGRLTRRYTAARSVFKYRYKGSLKDLDYSRKLDYMKKSMRVVMLRKYAKANSQYSFAKSKRRIGAFGIKGWISGY